MKAKTVGILISLLVLGSGTSWGQTCANLYCESFQLRDQCEGGNPLPDGATVMIYWDADANGPDANDPILPMGENGPNFNSFPLNGEMMLGLPGTFMTDPIWCLGAIVPNPPIFFLYVPVPNHDICWISETFIVSPGFNEYQICDWSCGDCFAMNAPGPVTGLTASQDLCDWIHVQWNATPTADGYNVFRDGTIIFTTTQTSFNYDNFLPGIYCYSFQVQAVNESGAGPISNSVQGCVARIPDSVTGVDATDNLCNIVVITWNPAARAENYQIQRNGNTIATVESSENRYEDHPPTENVYSYRMMALNSCGASNVSLSTTGRFLGTLPAVPIHSASTNHDDRIAVTWTGVDGESGYEILRSEEIHTPQFEVIDSTAENVTLYDDFSAAPGREYLYRVRAFSEVCGAGAPSVSVHGRRIEVEPIVFGEVIVTTNISGVMSAEAADLDADGDLDVVAAGVFANKVAWYENNGSWGFTEHELITGWRGARAVDVGDIDSDGDLDIVAVSRFENSLIWWNKVEWGYWMRPISSSVMGASDVEVVNINQDGAVEIVTTAATSSDLSVWHFHGDAGFDRQIFASNLPGARSLSATFFPLPLHTLAVSVAVAETGAIMQWSSVNSYVRETIGIVPGIVSCGTTHLNSEMDSLNDYYFCSDDGTFGWWEIGADEPHVISSLIESPRDVSAARIDGDLNNDLLLASGDEISWWRYTPNRFYRNVICDNLPQASVVRGLDADGDGDADVLCAGDNEIRFYLSTLTDEMHNSALAKQPVPDDNRISSLPREFELLANYPNPFNAVTNIRFALPEASDVKLAVFDITGRLVTTLANGNFAAGYHTFTFDANALSSGVYFYRLEAGTFVDTRKMVLLK